MDYGIRDVSFSEGYVSEEDTIAGELVPNYSGAAGAHVT